MNEVAVISFLDSFFSLFKARVEKYILQSNKIIGTIAWEGEVDKQDFSLSIEEVNHFHKLQLICEYLTKYNLIDGDRIIVSEPELINLLINSGWLENDAKKSIDYLCSFSIEMLDDDQETDSFFIHF